MKFSLLALSLVSAANAFVVPGAAPVSTKLNSEPFFGSSEGLATTSGFPASSPGGGLSAPGPAGGAIPLNEIWETVRPVLVQGDSLKTWTLTTPSVELVQVMMKTEGRPLNANVELWQGPDNTPQKMKVYVEDGKLRPFSVVIPTPRDQNAIAIYNTGHIEFPLEAAVEADAPETTGTPDLIPVTRRLEESGAKRTIQGGAIQTFPFDPTVQSVALMLKTDGRPLNSRIELMQGPNNNKQVMEIYTEDGYERPFFAVIDTPGVGNVVRVINTGTIEFPITASVEPYVIGPLDTGFNSPDGHFFLD